MAVCLYTSFAWGTASITEAGVTVGGTTYVEPGFNTINGVSFTVTEGGTLSLSFAYVKTTKDGSSDVCGATAYYSVYPASGSPSFTPISLGFGFNGSGYQQWQASPSINLASGLSAGSYKIAFYYEAFVNQSGSCPSTSSVYFSNFGSNFVANLTVSAPAPITLTHFTTRAIGQSSVELTWATATEHNNSRFEVEHTTDMERWKVIGTQAGSGNSNATRNYTFTHEKVAAGANYYRLRQIDYDGKSAYSPVRKVLLSGRGAAVVSPNPVVGTQISVYLNKTATGSAHIRLFDALGRQMQAWEVEVENDLVLPLDLSNVPAGLLFLQVNEETPIRVVKE